MTTSALTRINFRPPTGKVTWPCILVAGDEGAGKTFAAYKLSSSGRIGRAFAIDLGEGSADEYAPLGNYVVVTPKRNGQWTFADLYEQVCAIHDFAREEIEAGHAPVALTIDTMSDVDAMLKHGMNERAKNTAKNQAKLRNDPMAELDIPFHIRNETAAKHRKLMTKLLTFPGIVVLTARAKEVTQFENGNPIADAPKLWKVEGHRGLQFDASVVIRMDRDGPAQMVKARSLFCGVRPGKDAPRALPEDWTLEWLVFDALRVDPGNAAVRDLADLSDNDEEATYIVNPQVAAQQIADAATSAPNTDHLRALKEQATDRNLLNEQVAVNGGSGPLLTWLQSCYSRMVAAEDQEAAAAHTPAPASTPAPAPAPVQAPVTTQQGDRLDREPEPTPESAALLTEADVARVALEEHAAEVAAAHVPTPAVAAAPAAPATATSPRPTDPPEGATRAEKARHYWSEEFAYQADVLGINREVYAQQILEGRAPGALKPGEAQRALVPQREPVVAALNAQGRTLEASAYASVGIGFPTNLAVILGSHIA